jgi:hypothetical protein
VLASCCFLAWLILQVWRWRQHVPLKCQLNFFQQTTWCYVPEDRTLQLDFLSFYFVSLLFLKSRNWVVNSRVCLYIMISFTRLRWFVFCTRILTWQQMKGSLLLWGGSYSYTYLMYLSEIYVHRYRIRHYLYKTTTRLLIIQYKSDWISQNVKRTYAFITNHM